MEGVPRRSVLLKDIPTPIVSKDVMHPRLDKIKQHVKDNKVTYIVGVSCVAAGAAVGGVIVYLKLNGVSVDSSVDVSQVIAYKSPVTVNNTTIVELVRRGHPGFRVRNVETGEEFASIKRAAEMFGISATTLRRHLAGLVESVDGLKFENLGEMA